MHTQKHTRLVSLVRLSDLVLGLNIRSILTFTLVDYIFEMSNFSRPVVFKSVVQEPPGLLEFQGVPSRRGIFYFSL